MCDVPPGFLLKPPKRQALKKKRPHTLCSAKDESPAANVARRLRRWRRRCRIRAGTPAGGRPRGSGRALAGSPLGSIGVLLGIDGPGG